MSKIKKLTMNHLGGVVQKELIETINEIVDHLNSVHEDGCHIPRAALKPIEQSLAFNAAFTTEPCKFCIDCVGDSTTSCPMCGRRI
jgi:hypothetical protein